MFGQSVKQKSVFIGILQELLEEENFGFGQPWQLVPESLSAVVPILKKVACNRNYVVAQEISKEKISITDSGQIGKLRFRMAYSEKPVFVRAGTVLGGQGTQSRSVGMGMFLEPEKESMVDVFCVHASHRISADSHFSMQNDIAPRKVEEVLTSPTKNQSRIWAAAAVTKSRPQISHCPECGSGRLMQSYDADLICTGCGYVTPAGPKQNRPLFSLHPTVRDSGDSMINNLREMNAFNQTIEDMLSKMPVDLEKQVGIVIIDSKGVYGAEMFDHPDSWRAFSKSVVRNYADVLAKERTGEGLLVMKTERIPRAIREFLRKAMDLTENPVFRNKVGETRALSGELIGEYSMLGQDLIHLILKRNKMN